MSVGLDASFLDEPHTNTCWIQDRKSSPSALTRISTDLKYQRQAWRLKKIPLPCSDLVTSVDGVVIKLKIVKLFTWNSEYLNVVLFFTIVQLNGSSNTEQYIQLIAGKTNKLIYCNSEFHVFTIILKTWNSINYFIDIKNCTNIEKEKPSRIAHIKELLQKHAIHSRKDTPPKDGFSQLALQFD